MRHGCGSGRTVSPRMVESIRSEVRVNFEQARFNMVEQQIRTWEVLDQGVLDLLLTVRREDFVPASYRTLAFADLEIPLGDGERMWTPKLEAGVLQGVELKPDERALEIGTGSGYLTALLAMSCSEVTSVEIVPRLLAEADSKLAANGIRNVRLEQGDGARGWGKEAYDAVVLTGSVPLLPDSW